MTLKTTALILIVAFCGLVCVFFFVRPPQRHFSNKPSSTSNTLGFESLGKPLVPVAHIDDIVTGGVFIATVESRRIDTDAVTVYLRKGDGTKVAIREAPTDSTKAGLLKSLLLDAAYEFPLPNATNSPQPISAGVHK